MDLTPYFELRVKEILSELGERCGEYAVAEERREYLDEQIEPVITQRGEICISAGDSINIMDYIDTQGISLALTQQELYKQGFYTPLLRRSIYSNHARYSLPRRSTSALASSGRAEYRYRHCWAS